jgi:hypothetical protein
MKRCPQCEFIYEDDQSLCDMDGVLLVFDSRTLPSLHALATVSAPVPGKTARRNRMVPAFATLILMLAVGSVYYVSTTRNAAPNDFSSASVPTASAGAAAPAIEPTPQAISEPATETAKETPETPAPAEAKSTTPPARKVTVTKPVATKPAPKKDDSKVGSIIKKTGKILKKPFKF